MVTEVLHSHIVNVYGEDNEALFNPNGNNVTHAYTPPECFNGCFYVSGEVYKMLSSPNSFPVYHQNDVDRIHRDMFGNYPWLREEIGAFYTGECIGESLSAANVNDLCGKSDEHLHRVQMMSDIAEASCLLQRHLELEQTANASLLAMSSKEPLIASIANGKTANTYLQKIGDLAGMLPRIVASAREQREIEQSAFLRGLLGESGRARFNEAMRKSDEHFADYTVALTLVPLYRNPDEGYKSSGATYASALAFMNYKNELATITAAQGRLISLGQDMQTREIMQHSCEAYESLRGRIRGEEDPPAQIRGGILRQLVVDGNCNIFSRDMGDGYSASSFRST